MQPAPRFSLNDLDYASLFRHLLIFVGPAVLLFLVDIQHGTSLQLAVRDLYGGLLGIIIDTLRKFLDNPQPKV